MTQTLTPLPRFPSPPARLAPRPCKVPCWLEEVVTFPSDYAPPSEDLHYAAEAVDMNDLMADAFEALAATAPHSLERRMAGAKLLDSICSGVVKLQDQVERESQNH